MDLASTAAQHWAQFKGGDFPAVAVRDLAVQPRDHDLVLATHGRGIWIIDDITPLRALDAADAREAGGVLPARAAVQQRIDGVGGWAEGDAAFVGANPPSDAVITYYQQTRHLFGDIKLEVLDANGKFVDTIPTQQAARHQPRRLVDAREAAARAARRAARRSAPRTARACCPARTR